MELHTNPRCSLETLKQAYVNVYDAMRKNWREASPNDYQGIMLQDVERFLFFVKKRELGEEDTVIRFLISKFRLQEQVHCSSWMLREGSGYGYGDTVYMWVDRQNLQKIVEIFGFEFLKP